MKIDEIRNRAFATPLTSPSYPTGPYRFFDREFIAITYRSDIEALRAVVPEPLGVSEPIVKYEFIRMPDSTGFGDYTETGQVIPVNFNGKNGVFVHSMHLDDDAPIAGRREIWGLPKKLARPKISHEGDVIVCTLHYGSVLCAEAAMGYKHKAADIAAVQASLGQPNFLIKIIPHVDGTLRICELVRYYLEDITMTGARAAPARLGLFDHVLADVAKLPVREVLSAVHFKADFDARPRRGRL